MPTNSSLRLRFTRLSPTHHRFEAERADGSREVMDLETRSYLPHDLAHLALESEGGFRCGFYGLLASGGSYQATADTWIGEAGQIERVVAIMHRADESGIDPEALCGSARNAFDAAGDPPPAWLTEDLIRKAVARLRALNGQWRATPFGQTMDVEFRLDASG